MGYVIYGETYLNENEKALAQLREQMSPEAVVVAEQMADDWLIEDAEDEGEE
jgi:hypothetical protein